MRIVPPVLVLMFATACASNSGAGGGSSGAVVPPGSLPPTENPCVQIEGTAIGDYTTVDGSYGPVGKLVTPPEQCAKAASFAHAGTCPASHSYWFSYEYQGYSAYGVAGGTWKVKQGSWDQQDDVDDLLSC